MGRQFSFFLGPEDAAEFENLLRSVEELVFVDYRPSVAEVRALPGLSTSSWRTLLARSCDVPSIRFRPVPTQKFFSTDVLTQSFIECDVPPKLQEGWLYEGRLYLVAQYWDEHEEKVWKSGDFLKWGEAVFRKVKKSLSKVDHDFYAGKQALDLRAQGVRFRNLDGWPPPPSAISKQVQA